MNADRKYEFTWALLGNISEGRPNLGHMMRLEVYRLMQFCFRDVMEQRHGNEEADAIMYQSGYLAGTHFHRQLIGETASLAELVRNCKVPSRISVSAFYAWKNTTKRPARSS